MEIKNLTNNFLNAINNELRNSNNELRNSNNGEVGYIIIMLINEIFSLRGLIEKCKDSGEMRNDLMYDDITYLIDQWKK